MAEPATTTCKNYPWRNSQRWQLQFYGSSIAFLGELATIFLKQAQLIQLCVQLGQRAWPDEETNNADYGLRISGLIITICLTLII